MSENTTEALNKLFEAVPPVELKQHVNTLLFQYLDSVETDAMPKDFKDVCESIRFLIQFLEKASS